MVFSVVRVGGISMETVKAHGSDGNLMITEFFFYIELIDSPEHFKSPAIWQQRQQHRFSAVPS